MKRTIVAMFILFVLFGASAGVAASKKVIVISEEIIRKSPPSQQMPQEISSRHQAYLNDHSLIGTVLLKGRSREAALDLAAKRGAHLVLVTHIPKMFDKYKRVIVRYDRTVSTDHETIRFTTGPEAKFTEGFYLEMYAPGRDDQEAGKRFCDYPLPSSVMDYSYYTSGTKEDLEQFLNRGIDASLILNSLVKDTCDLGYSQIRDIRGLPTLQTNLELIALALRHGADPKDAINRIAEFLEYHIKLYGYLAVKRGALDEVEWPPRVAGHDTLTNLKLGQAFLAEALRILNRHRNR